MLLPGERRAVPGEGTAGVLEEERLEVEQLHLRRRAGEAERPPGHPPQSHLDHRGGEARADQEDPGSEGIAEVELHLQRADALPLQTLQRAVAAQRLLQPGAGVGAPGQPGAALGPGQPQWVLLGGLLLEKDGGIHAPVDLPQPRLDPGRLAHRSLLLLTRTGCRR